MFGRGFFIVRLLATLLLIGLLIVGGTALYRAGFTQGYAQAALTATKDAPQAAPGYLGYPGWMYPGFGFFPFMMFPGMFFFGLLFFFVVVGLFRFAIFGPRRWGYPPMGAHGEHGHGYPPPWARGWSQNEPEAGKQEPEKSSE